MRTTPIFLLLIAAIAACTGKNSATSTGNVQSVELLPNDENTPTLVVEDVVTRSHLSEAVVNLQQRFSNLGTLLKTNTKLNERIDAVNAYRKEARTTSYTFDVSSEAAQEYLMSTDRGNMDIGDQSLDSKLEEIRRDQKPRDRIHDDLDALDFLAVVSKCGPECMEWELEFHESSFQKTIAASLSSQEEEMVKAWAFCEELELGNAEGDLFVPIGGENDRLFSIHLNNLVALQREPKQEIQSLALTLEKECWRAWLSLCLDDCKEIATTLPALSKAFPHMSNTLRTYQKKTQKRPLAQKDLKQLLGIAP